MKTLLFSIVMTLSGSVCTAQIGMDVLKRQAGNALTGAVERKLESEMNKMADKAVNKYWDRVLGKYYQGAFDGSNDSTGAKRIPFMLDANVKTEDSYTFNSSVKIKIETYKKNGKLDEAMFMTSYGSKSGEYTGTELPDDKKQGSSMFMIYDLKNNAMIMLMDSKGDKKSLAYTILIDEKSLDDMTDDKTKKQEAPKIEKLNSKTIMGYDCQGYKYVTTDAETEIWTTQSDVLGMQSMFNMQKGMSGKNAPKMPDNYPTGSIMELDSKDLKSGEKTLMRVVEVNKSVSVTKTIIDYPRMGAPSDKK